MTVHDTSGQAHPYWYEWFVGLVEVVKLLNPDEGIKSVVFQSSSIKGWDDVVVNLVNGRRCYQVKHSRDGDSLSFGDLVGKDDKGKSLLAELFNGQQASALDDTSTKLILFTNRSVGTRWSTVDSGQRRPPLDKFWTWLTSEIVELDSLSNLTIPASFKDGWREFNSCLNSSDDARKLAFLRQLVIRTGEDALEGLEERILSNLSTAFGVSIQQADTLLKALCHALRSWTTGHAGVTIETLCTALAVSASNKELAQAPPPPEPFFPSRLPVAADLEAALLGEAELPVIFVSGEPGSGKTSVVSWLANRRTEEAFQGIIGVRFYCFEPIRPEQPFIATDASRVHPEDLWFSLLAQMRDGLKNRLHELKVPLRNAFLNWHEARAHVLRLADVLGKEQGRQFVIAIDGIDHAARAAQVMPEAIESFFNSLPSPSELAPKQIRLLIAGQPPEYYRDQYPQWLQGKHELVKRIDLPKLDSSDIRTLLVQSPFSLPEENVEEAVRLIEDLAQGNTLAIVFAVAECESIESLLELELKLKQRNLSDGLTAYYNSVWQYALHNRAELSCSLAGAIALARRPVSADQLTQAFADWNIPKVAWQQILRNLGPLLTEAESGFQIRHNDVRIFLASIFQQFTNEEQSSVASQLATYFGSKDADLLAAHLQLFPLLDLAGRQHEKSHVYNVDWVMEGWMNGIEFSQLKKEGEEAASSLAIAKSWSCVVSVACGLQTLERLSNDSDFYPSSIERQTSLPPFLPTEASVKPRLKWSRQDFAQLITDSFDLLEHGEEDRARGLLNRWFRDLTFQELVASLSGIESNLGGLRKDAKPRLDQLAAADFENLGTLYARLSLSIRIGKIRSTVKVENDAIYAFEIGFVTAVTESATATSANELFRIFRPRFRASWELAVRRVSLYRNWLLVRDLLHEMQNGKWTDLFVAETAWYALASQADSDDSVWLDSLKKANYGLSSSQEHTTYFKEDDYLAHLNVCRALGWTRLGFDLREIADSVLAVFAPYEMLRSRTEFQLLFHASAMLGRIEYHLRQGGPSAATNSVTPSQLARLLKAMWTRAWWDGLYLKGAQLAQELAAFAIELSGDHQSAVEDVAIALAQDKILGPRMEAIWGIVKRCGRLDLLRDWVQHFLEQSSPTWQESNHDARERVAELVPYAESLGLLSLATDARLRSQGLLVSYHDRKEYSFGACNEWFGAAARNDPSIWATEGWQLWQLCARCDEQDGDNRYKSELRNVISAAAMRCGSADWWRLTSTTLESSNNEGWHFQVRERLVGGALLAAEQGWLVPEYDLSSLFSLAVSLSYWFNKGESSSLQILANCLVAQASEPFRKELAALCCRVVKTHEAKELAGTSASQAEPSGSGWRDEKDFWTAIESSVADAISQSKYYSLDEKLLEIALVRARLHGNSSLREGLRALLYMHERWAFGATPLNRATWKTLPEATPHATWEWIAVQFQRICLSSASAGVLAASLTGLQLLVDSKPSVVGRLFDEIHDEWPRMWLLNAAERWAVLYPQAMTDSLASIQASMNSENLYERLQAWIVHSRLCDANDATRPDFPLSVESSLGPQDVARFDKQLIELPPMFRGLGVWANRYSAAKSVLNHCRVFGFNFDALEGLVAEKLYEIAQSDDSDIRTKGPHRYADSFCSSLDAEHAISQAIQSILSDEWCDNEIIAQLCHALLPNEDPWIYSSPPMPFGESAMKWLDDDEHGSTDVDAAARQRRMVEAATLGSLVPGWRVVSARVTDFTWKADVELHYWLEELTDLILIQPMTRPTCPGGRSFMWWIGKPKELNRQKFVSGLFVGGRSRLFHCQFEVRPPIEWQTLLGWEPNRANPLEWLHGGEVVAQYERFHGRLGDENHRQPLVSRWIVSESAYTQMESVIGSLRSRSEFRTATIRQD